MDDMKTAVQSPATGSWFGEQLQNQVFEGGGGVPTTHFRHQVRELLQHQVFEGGEGSQLHIFVTRLEVPSDFFPTTSEEKWRTGRWSPEGDGGEERRTFIFE